jgi:prolyl-tRNA synthetase
VPTIVVVGRGLASGVVEVKDRRTGERTEVALSSAVEHLRASCGPAPRRSEAPTDR